MIEELSKDELIELLTAYDRYIQSANDEERYVNDGFYPVCISEFYRNDFELWRVK